MAGEQIELSEKRSDLGRPSRQFAALPLRGQGKTLEVLLVTSRDTGRWVLPKGWAEDDLSGSKLAEKEAFEEAGIIGAVAAAPIGAYGYEKRLPKHRCRPCYVAVFTMRVKQELDDWPERRQRQRQWFKLTEAAGLVQEPELADLFLRIAARAA
jgi:8-oxo-dGTP pyrophosphatase MutT (NUDIX family)